MSKTLVIGEPGCTAQGDHDTYLRLIETAARCGCDCFKPQWVSNADLMCERRHIGRDHPKRAYYRKAYGWLQFPVEWHAEFRDRCHALGMAYACTAFLPQDVATLHPFVDYHKVSSFEARDAQMIAAHHAVPAGHLFVSTGIAAEIDELFNDWSGLCAYFLHCVSAYPAPLGAMNLRSLKIGYGSQLCEGLSDHSRHLLAGALAFACGAEYIETHYRLDDCDPDNPDYAVAFTPQEFATYIKNIRDAETMLGDGVKRVQDCEAWALPYRVT